MSGSRDDMFKNDSLSSTPPSIRKKEEINEMKLFHGFIVKLT